MLARAKRALLVVVPAAAVLFWTSLATAEGSQAVAYGLSNMHTHPWFKEVMVASLIGWVTGVAKGFRGSRDWLQRYWATVPTVVVFGADLIVFALVGGYLGTGIFRPSDFVQALSAGVTWPLGLLVLGSKK